MSRTVAAVLAGFALGIATACSSGSAPATAAASSHPTASAVLQLSGTGNVTSAAFTTGSDWSLWFILDCPSPQAGFSVSEDGATLAERTGGQVSGTTYVHGDAGGHRLRITTACSWTITATDGDRLPRATDGATT